MHFMHTGSVDARSKAQLVRAAKEHMDETGLTQREFAEQLGITQGHLSRLLRGDFSSESRAVRLLQRALTGQPALRSDPSEARDLIEQAQRITHGMPQRTRALLDLMRAVQTLQQRKKRIARR